MLYLIEELKENNTVFILQESYPHLIYGEYKVIERISGNRNHQYATLELQNIPKKSRYFRKQIEFKGYYIEFKYTTQKYKVFDDMKELIEYFCKNLLKTPALNPKLISKFKNKYPIYFKNYKSENL